MIAGGCYIIDMDHGTCADVLIRKQENDVKAVEIGADCWIAANTTILKGCSIEDGAVIGANSLVKGNIGVNEIAVGGPARVIKKRSHGENEKKNVD